MLCHRFQYAEAQNNKNPTDFIHYYHYSSGYCFQHTENLQMSLGAIEDLAKPQQNGAFCHSITFHVKELLTQQDIDDISIQVKGSCPTWWWGDTSDVSGEPWICVCTSAMDFGPGMGGKVTTSGSAHLGPTVQYFPWNHAKIYLTVTFPKPLKQQVQFPSGATGKFQCCFLVAGNLFPSFSTFSLWFTICRGINVW